MDDDSFTAIDRPGPVANALSADMLGAAYADMRRIARRIMANDQVGRVLQPTELANEAAIRLLRSNLSEVRDQGHFLGLAARSMRQVLIDEARKRLADKRQAIGVMTMWPGESETKLVDIEALDRALVALDAYSPEHAQIVELRFMLGLSLHETVQVTGLSVRTVTRRWQAARIWLLARLNEDEAA